MSHPLSCRMCAAALTPDQRYCVECGTRARPLPGWVVTALERVEAIRAKAAPAAPLPVHRPAYTPIRVGPLTIPWAMPSPRALAAAALVLVGFGTAVGAAGLSVADTPIRIFLGLGGQTASPSTPTTGAVAQVGGGGGGGTTVIETVGGGRSGGGNNTTGSTGDGSTSGSTTSTTGTTTTTPGPLPPIKNVWVIDLDGQGYNQTFASNSPDAYLSKTLALQGEIVSAYYATATSPLANEIAMISGQGPTEAMLNDCPAYSAITPGKVSSTDSQVLGNGCVFPKTTQTLFSELTAAGDTWRTYVQGLGSVAKAKTSRVRRATHAEPPLRQLWVRLTRTNVKHRAHTRATTTPTVLAASCRHPQLGSRDGFGSVSANDSYVTWRNPAVFFSSITASKDCASDDIGLDSLAGDLKSSAKTPNVSFIFPDPCDDGSDMPCTAGASAGTAQSDKFLKQIVKEIMASPAYKAGGMIVVTFDEAPQTGQYASQASCCNTPTYPNLPAPTTTTTTDTTTTPTATTGTDTTGTGTTGTDTTGTGTVTTTGTDTTDTGTTTTDTTTSTGTDTTGTDTTGTGTDTTGTDTTGTGTDTTGTSTTGTTTTPSLCTGGVDDLGNPCTGGGGQVGMLVLSKWVKGDTVDATDQFNHFSLLLSIEELFGLKPIGYAAQVGTAYFNGTLFYQNYNPNG